MSLWFNLYANAEHLGLVEIRRVTYSDNPQPDDRFTYDITVNDRMIGQVTHRYGDGPWALVQRVTTLMTYLPMAPSVDEGGEAPQAQAGGDDSRP